MHKILFLSLTRVMYLVKEIVQIKGTLKLVAYLEEWKKLQLGNLSHDLKRAECAGVT